MATILVGGQGVPGPIVEIEAETGRHFHFEGTEALPLDTFDVVLEGTREEVEERALPFREGEEVLVQIEEPHMYNDDDAVAKLDGYVVSIIGAAPLVGERTLVRIEKVARSAAQASLVNPPPGVASNSGASNDGAAAATVTERRQRTPPPPGPARRPGTAQEGRGGLGLAEIVVGAYDAGRVVAAAYPLEPFDGLGREHALETRPAFGEGQQALAAADPRPLARRVSAAPRSAADGGFDRRAHRVEEKFALDWAGGPLAVGWTRQRTTEVS